MRRAQELADRRIGDAQALRICFGRVRRGISGEGTRRASISGDDGCSSLRPATTAGRDTVVTGGSARSGAKATAKAPPPVNLTVRTAAVMRMFLNGLLEPVEYQ